MRRFLSPANIALVIIGIFTFFPIAWMAITAVSSTSDIFRFPPAIITRTYTLEHFKSVLFDSPIPRYFINGILVSLATTAISLAVAFLAGYSFSKFRFRGRQILMSCVLAAQMVPLILLLLTLYSAFDRLQLLDSYLGLIVAFTTFTLPLAVFMMKNSFDSIPNELLESAQMDGASQRRVITSVLLPLMGAPMVAVAIFSFIRAWNDMPLALTLAGTAKQTLPAGLVLTYIGEFENSYGPLLAASALTTIPIALVFVFLQRFFMAGILNGAIK